MLKKLWLFTKEHSAFSRENSLSEMEIANYWENGKLGNPTFGFYFTSYEETVKEVNNLKIRKVSQKIDIQDSYRNWKSVRKRSFLGWSGKVRECHWKSRSSLESQGKFVKNQGNFSVSSQLLFECLNFCYYKLLYYIFVLFLI